MLNYKEIWASWPIDTPEGPCGNWELRQVGENDTRFVRADLYARALSAAKEAAGELEALHKAKMIPPGSADILEMVQAEIAELEK